MPRLIITCGSGQQTHCVTGRRSGIMLLWVSFAGYDLSAKEEYFGSALVSINKVRICVYNAAQI